jgi:hypothetical protein
LNKYTPLYIQPMKKPLLLLASLFYFSMSFSQTITVDSLKIKPSTISNEHTVLKELKCQSIQSRLLYDDPSMYSFILGNLKEKAFQTFKFEGQTGSVLYFIVDKETSGSKGFIEGLLWGGSKPTKEHPEEIIMYGNIMIIISYPYKSAATTYFKKALTK